MPRFPNPKTDPPEFSEQPTINAHATVDKNGSYLSFVHEGRLISLSYEQISILWGMLSPEELSRLYTEYEKTTTQKETEQHG